MMRPIGACPTLFITSTTESAKLESGRWVRALRRIAVKGFASPADVGHAAPSRSRSRNVHSAPAISRFSPTPLLTGNAPGTIRRTKRWREDYHQGRGARRPGRPTDDDHAGLRAGGPRTLPTASPGYQYGAWPRGRLEPGRIS